MENSLVRASFLIKLWKHVLLLVYMWYSQSPDFLRVCTHMSVCLCVCVTFEFQKLSLGRTMGECGAAANAPLMTRGEQRLFFQFGRREKCWTEGARWVARPEHGSHNGQIYNNCPTDIFSDDSHIIFDHDFLFLIQSFIYSSLPQQTFSTPKTFSQRIFWFLIFWGS
jgi:hypothetical protein